MKQTYFYKSIIMITVVSLLCSSIHSLYFTFFLGSTPSHCSSETEKCCCCESSCDDSTGSVECKCGCGCTLIKDTSFKACIAEVSFQ